MALYKGTTLISAVYKGSSLLSQVYFGTSPVGVNLYVDSVSGSNANDGLTALTPKQTIAALPLATGVTINLKRGSVWREKLDVTAYPGVTVRDYGTGVLPVLDCSDVIPNSGWVQPNVGTYPNVWQYTVTNAAGISGMFASIWINGVRPKFVSTIALVNTTAGTFTISGGAGGGVYGASTTIYQIYSLTNPNSDGKLYEWASRDYGLTGSNFHNFSNIHTRRNAHNNGSLVAGTNAVVTGCIMEDGCKHNTYVSPGSVITNCIAWKCDWIVAERQGWAGFVSHNATNTGVETVSYVGCQAVADINVFTARAAVGMSGFYCHTNGSPTSNVWGRINYTDCSAQYCDTAFDGTDCLGVTHLRTHIKGSTFAIGLPDGSSSGSGNIANNFVTDCWVEESDGIVCNRAVAVGGANTTIDGLRVYQSTGFNHAYIYSGGNVNNVTIKNCALARTAGSTGVITFVSLPSTNGETITGNVMWGDNSGFGEDLVLTGTGESLNHNAYGGSNSGFNLNGLGYLKLNPYFTAIQPGQEFGSVKLTTNPFTNAPAGDFSLTGASGLNTTTFGLQRFPTYQTLLTPSAIAAM